MKKIALIAAMALVVAACGGGSGAGSGGGLNSEEKLAAQEFAVGFREGFDDQGDGVSVSEDQAVCVGEKYVGAFGIARLEEIGTGSDDPNFTVPVDEARQMAGLFLDCVPMRDMIIDSFSAEGADMTEGQIACFSEAFTDEVLEDMLVVTFAGEDAAPDAQASLIGAMFSCFDA
ncbi:hypothetical protein BMS3Bbin02_01337 [bacterium BMS3Bbin02]|nr:hypothetical protein BMS3Bbin02_01337 [bacterium BMS3Bbin02]